MLWLWSNHSKCDEKKVGYVPKNALSRNEVLCKRCFKLKNYHQLQETNLTDDDF